MFTSKMTNYGGVTRSLGYPIADEGAQTERLVVKGPAITRPHNENQGVRYLFGIFKYRKVPLP